MSSFTQFTGNAVPFGQQLNLLEYRDNPTINGIEYLRYGVLKGSAGYSSLLSDWPALGFNTNNGSTYSHGGGTSSGSLILTDGTRYYSFNQGTNVPPTYGTSLTSAWQTPVTAAPTSQSLDAFRFGSSGTTLISLGNANTTNCYIVGTNATAFSITAASSAGAANTAGTFGVIVKGGTAVAGNVYTSNAGTTWTSRTPSGGSLTASVAFATWSPVGNCFIYIDSNSNVGTTTDGFTITSRGTLGVGTIQSAGFQTLTNASSSASTLMAVYSPTNGKSYICRTTDGINFTAPAANTLFNGYTYVSSIQYFNGAYYALCNQVLFKSTDEGLTWSRVPYIVPTPYTSLWYLLSVQLLNGNIIASWTYSGQNYPLYGVLSGIDTAAYIGMVPPSNASPNNYANSYVRIK